MTNACNAWHLDRWHWASWQTEHNWAPSTVQIMVQAVHCTAPGIMGLPHSRPGQRNLRFILWLNESITRILLRGHTSVPCSWHHAGFCSETDQKRNVIADMTYIHPLLRSKTKLSFSIKTSHPADDLSVFNLSKVWDKDDCFRVWCPGDYESSSVLGVGGAQTSQGWGAQIRTGPWHGAALITPEIWAVRWDGSIIKIMPTSRNCPAIPRITLYWLNKFFPKNFLIWFLRKDLCKVDLVTGHHALYCWPSTFVHEFCILVCGLGLRNMNRDNEIVMTHKKASLNAKESEKGRLSD